MKPIGTGKTSCGGQPLVCVKPTGDYESELVYPQIFVFNLGPTRTRQIADAPNHDEGSLIQGFVDILQRINDKGYIVQGAMYSPEGVNIFIETEDEDWPGYANCRE